MFNNYNKKINKNKIYNSNNKPIIMIKIIKILIQKLIKSIN